MTKLLILGATGNLAGMTVAALAGAKDIQLRLASSRDAGVERLRAAHASSEVVRADWYDLESLRRAFDGVNRALLVSNDLLTDEKIATANIVAAAKATRSLDLIVRVIGAAPGLAESDMTQEWLATGVGTAQRWISMPLLKESKLPVAYVNAAGALMHNLLWNAGEIKASRRLLYPGALSAPQLWIADRDLVDVIAKVLIEGPAAHAGKEYALTGAARHTIAEVAAMVSEEIGEKVTWVDTEQAMRAALGGLADKLMTAMRYEQRHNVKVPITDTVERLLGRPQTTLRQYIAAHRAAFA